MKRKLSALFILVVLIATACAPQVVYVPVTTTPPPAPADPPTPAPVSDPPTLTATGPVDCRPYPSCKFLYIAGIDNGESVPVLAKGKPGLSEPGDDWWEVQYEEGGATFDCWVYSRSYVTASGDFSGLKVNPVIIPTEAPKPHCDKDIKLKKIYPGLKVTLPYSQAPYRGHTGWFDGMSEYSGMRTTVTAIAGLDLGWCQTVYVEADGGQYPWRVRDLIIGWKKGD